MKVGAKRSITIGMLYLVVLAGFFVLYKKSHQPAQVSASTTEASTAEPTKSAIAMTGETITEIQLPSLGIQADIVPGGVDAVTGIWNVSINAAHLADYNPEGNTNENLKIIYAHNSDNLFGNLKKIKENDEAILTNEDNTTQHYTLKRQIITHPDDIAALSPQENEDLILITCSGIINQKRQIAYFTRTP